ncbi:hypothetical protein SKAU_G00148780 [Synaphobranchus kaupii]|uniref:Uncharacterized protein n=1 Tax=Synaphobranchus kaupii TaxID=118154 RepID=A0A9Q1J2U3_SYNKA|nr:hypothetical protein SKAU_G00148780 [Synaphobranchus kaupii]
MQPVPMPGGTWRHRIGGEWEGGGTWEGKARPQTVPFDHPTCPGRVPVPDASAFQTRSQPVADKPDCFAFSTAAVAIAHLVFPSLSLSFPTAFGPTPHAQNGEPDFCLRPRENKPSSAERNASSAVRCKQTGGRHKDMFYLTIPRVYRCKVLTPRSANTESRRLRVVNALEEPLVEDTVGRPPVTPVSTRPPRETAALRCPCLPVRPTRAAYLCCERVPGADPAQGDDITTVMSSEPQGARALKLFLDLWREPSERSGDEKTCLPQTANQKGSCDGACQNPAGVPRQLPKAVAAATQHPRPAISWWGQA